MRHTHRFKLPAALSSLWRARRALDELPALADGDGGTLKLLTTEALATVIRHGDAHPTQYLVVRVESSDERVRVEVECPGEGDRSEARITGLRGVDPSLMVIDLLAERWGTSGTPRFALWFETLDRRRAS